MATSSAQAHVVIAFAMIAEGFAEYVRWARRVGAARPTDDSLTIDTQHAAEEVYKLAMKKGSALRKRYADEREAEGADRGGALQDREALLDDAPALSLLAAEHARVLRLIEGAPNDPTTAHEAQRLLMASMVAMGGLRIREVAMLRLRSFRSRGPQSTSKTPAHFVIAGRHRKKNVQHYVPLIAAIIPRALFEYHVNIGRQILSAGAASRSDDSLWWRNTKGAAKGMATLPGTAAAITAARWFTQWRHAALTRAGLEVYHGGRGHHGPHAERHRVLWCLEQLNKGHLGYKLLGHKPADSTRKKYGKVTAADVAELLGVVMTAAPWARQADADAQDPGSAREARTLREARRREDAALATLLKEQLVPAVLAASAGEISLGEGLGRSMAVLREAGLVPVAGPPKTVLQRQ